MYGCAIRYLLPYHLYLNKQDYKVALAKKPRAPRKPKTPKEKDAQPTNDTTEQDESIEDKQQSGMKNNHNRQETN